MTKIDYDTIVITPSEYEEMYKQLVSMNISDDRIKIMIFMPNLCFCTILGYVYWGQHGEDLILASIFARIGVKKPSYLDLGANLPAFNSNTWFLYMQGCRGINIEANPQIINLLRRMRPEDVNLNIGVGIEEGTAEYYLFSDVGGINTFSKEVASGMGRPIREVMKLPVYTLKKIVDEYCTDGFPDFLDCDIEGMDYAVLKDYDLQTNGPKVVCVEVGADAIVKFDDMLSQKGYFKFCRIGVNNIYVRNEYSWAVNYTHI